MAQTIIKFSDNYREACFYSWYNNGRPKIGTVKWAEILKSMPPDPLTGERPKSQTVRKWMEEDGWEMRADALDAEVSLQLDREAIQKRVETLRELAEDGRFLKEQGKKFLMETEDPFKGSPAAAVRAIVAGAEMQMRFTGQAEMLSRIAGMSDKELDRLLARLVSKAEGEIIDGDEIDEIGEGDEADDANGGASIEDILKEVSKIEDIDGYEDTEADDD
jgi:hypothetical protein